MTSLQTILHYYTTIRNSFAGYTPQYETGPQSSLPETPTYSGATTWVVFDQTTYLAAKNNAVPGDVVEIVNGTYAAFDLNFGGVITGDASKYLVIRPQTPGGVTLTGTSRITVRNPYFWITGIHFENADSYPLFINTDDIRITQCTFKDNGIGGTPAETIRIFRTSNRCTIDNCDISGTRLPAIIAFSPIVGDSNYLGTQGHIIEYNTFHNINTLDDDTVVLSTVGGELNLAADYGNVFRFNRVENCSRPGEIVSLKTEGWTIEYNTFRNVVSRISIRFAHNCVIRGNRLQNSGGITLAGSNHVVENNHVIGENSPLVIIHGYYNAGTTTVSYSPTKNCSLRHNTWKVTGASGFREVILQLDRPSLDFFEALSGNFFENNVIWRESSGDYFDNASHGDLIANNDWARNYIWNTADGAYPGGVLPPDYLGNPADANPSVDPELIFKNDLLIPRSTSSPLVNAGRGSESLDVLQHARDALPDVGAVEHT